jgi:predicted amidohydrolase
MRLNEGIYNVTHLFEPNGTLHLHAKTHIFPGELGAVVRAIGWMSSRFHSQNVGLNVCYELEIPECTRILVDKGVQIIPEFAQCRTTGTPASENVADGESNSPSRRSLAILGLQAQHP